MGRIHPFNVFISSTMLLVLFGLLWFSSIESSGGVMPLSIGVGLFLSLSCVALSAHIRQWNLEDPKTQVSAVALLAISTLSLSAVLVAIAT